MDSLKRIQVNLPLQQPAHIRGIWEVDDVQKRASWELYVEMVTRISVMELKPQEGLLREALSSLYSIFDATRGILRNYGPEVARPRGENELSFGYLSVTMLNSVLRPVLAKWHPLLLDHESLRDEDTSPLQHERDWDKSQELREVIQELRRELAQFSEVLGQASGASLLNGEQNRP